MAWCDDHHRNECDASRSRGRGTCHGPAVDGSDPFRCRMHIGSRQGHANAAIRAAVARWTSDMQTVDPGELLLRLMTVAYLRAEQHADELDNILTEHGWRDAFVGDAMGEFGKIGEYAKQLAVWEAQERKQAADLAVKAVAAGLEERRVRLAEDTAQELLAVVRGVVEALGHDPSEPAVQQVVRQQFALVVGEG